MKKINIKLIMIISNIIGIICGVGAFSISLYLLITRGIMFKDILCLVWSLVCSIYLITRLIRKAEWR